MDKEKLSILLVEDNGMFVNIAKEILADHNVTSETTANAGLKAYKEINPDITFLDISLPDDNGHTVLKEIKFINPDAYVIMLTASRLKEDILKSMDAGAEGYVMKPFSSKMIHECIKDYYE